MALMCFFCFFQMIPCLPQNLTPASQGKQQNCRIFATLVWISNTWYLYRAFMLRGRASRQHFIVEKKNPFNLCDCRADLRQGKHVEGTLNVSSSKTSWCSTPAHEQGKGLTQELQWWGLAMPSSSRSFSFVHG